jgi:hypothetical protein
MDKKGVAFGGLKDLNHELPSMFPRLRRQQLQFISLGKLPHRFCE